MDSSLCVLLLLLKKLRFLARCYQPFTNGFFVEAISRPY